MKKYLMFFLLTISTFLTAQEQEEFETISNSKWQIGQGNVAFGTSLSYSNLKLEDDNDEVRHYIGAGSQNFTGNNIPHKYCMFKTLADFGIFSQSATGTYLAYGLTNHSMIYVSTDIYNLYIDNDDDTLKLFGSSLTASYVYSKKINKNFDINFAPYISLPFIGVLKQSSYEDYSTYNFEQPVTFGINFVASLKSDLFFVDFMFNYNMSSKKEAEIATGDYNGEETIPSFNTNSFAFYIGNQFTNDFSAKMGLLLTSAELGGSDSQSGTLLQLIFENNITENIKAGITFEYGLNSDFYRNKQYLSSIVKMQFIF